MIEDKIFGILAGFVIAWMLYFFHKAIFSIERMEQMLKGQIWKKQKK